MQAFVICTAQCQGSDPHLDPPMVFYDREAAYRHYKEGGGQVPKNHKLEPLMTKGDRLIALYVVDIPDRRKYDRAFVLELVKKIQDGELSQSEASRLYGPSQSRISEWVRTFAAGESAMSS